MEAIMKKVMILMVLVSFSSFGQIKFGLGDIQAGALMNSHIVASHQRTKLMRKLKGRASKARKIKISRKAFNELRINDLKLF